MTKVIFVPIMYQGRELKAPFLLFVDWTVEQRKRYANDLREVKKFRAEEKARGYLPTVTAATVVAHNQGKLDARTLDVVVKTLCKHGAHDKASNVAWVPGEKPLEDLWLDMQIGMVDVPTFEF